MAMTPPAGSIYNAVDAVLKGLRPLGSNLAQPNPSGRYAGSDDVYEAFLMSEVLESLRRIGVGNIGVVGPPGPVVLRRAPGRITTSGTSFSYIEFSCGRRVYELHTGINLSSRSNAATAEADVLVVSKCHADRVRAAGTDASYRCARLVIEAKFFTASLNTVVARSYVGLGVRAMCRNCVEALVAYRAIDANAVGLVVHGRPSFHAFASVGHAGPGLTALRQYLDHELRRL